MKHKLPSLLTLMLPLAVIALAIPLRTALAQEGGVVQGNVINKTTGEPVSDQPLRLHVTRPDGTAGSNLEATSGSDGGFTFEGGDLGPGAGLALCTTYQGAMYHEPFEAPADGSAVSHDVAVYETTDSDEAIGLRSTHVVFYPRPEDSTVEVKEFLMFENTGNQTFVGAGEGGKGKPGETLHFTFPEGASHAMLYQGLSEQQAQWHESGFCSLAPVYPGQQNVVYSYVLPYSGKGSLRLVRPLDYRPAEVLVMTYGNQGRVTGQGVVSEGTVDVPGEGQYGLYRAVVAPSQTALELELSGLAGGGFGSPMGGNLKVLAGGLTGLGLVVGLGFALVRKRRRTLAPAAVVNAPDRAEDLDEQEWNADESE